MESYYSIHSSPTHSISTKTFISDLPAIQCVKYDEDGAYLAAGCNGKIALITTAKMHTINCEDSITSIVWKPRISTSKTKNVLIASESLGAISQWHTTSRKLVYRIETPCEVFSIDYHRWFNLILCGGRDGVLRLYDDITKTLVTEFEQKHTNRIFCVKAHPDDENILISAGWDSTVQIWDIRTSAAIRTIMGPHICGESIDIKGDLLLAGSWRDKNSLQVFDFPTGRLIKDVPLNAGSWVYSSKFSNDGSMCIAAGSNVNQLVLFEGFNQIGNILGFPQPLFTADITKNKKNVAVGCGDGTVTIFNIN